MIFLSLAAIAAMLAPVDFYIGTYTAKDGSRGIYHAQLDPRTGALSAPELAAEANGPSFLAIHPNGKYLYAVLEPTNGSVNSYAIEADHRLRLLNTQAAPGADPCHVSIDPAGHFVFTSGYGGGNVACFPIARDGSLQAFTTNFHNSGSGPDKSRQDKPHLHSAYAEGAFVYACDLGTDEVLVFHNDEGRLTLSEPRATKVAAGGGPRHLALHPNGQWVYANSEMGNAVSFLKRDKKSGALTLAQTLSTLPAGDTARNTTSEIMLHPSGKWLYVSNRGHDSIAVYQIDKDGELRAVEVFKAGVREPRGFSIDPSGRWLVVGGQNSQEVTALRIDDATGKLGAGPNRISVHSPVCIVFRK